MDVGVGNDQHEATPGSAGGKIAAKATSEQASDAFPETADIETSTDAYAARFAGPAGAWMLEVQERITRRLLGPHAGGTVLDVGGGHGQLAVPLARAGWDVTVLGSAPSCAHRLAPVKDRVNFQVGNVIALPFADRAFDVAICFRLLTHCQRWPDLVRELCRVARAAVIVDYPTSQSVNAIAPALFGAKKKVETSTRPWRLFRHREVRAAFAASGFPLAAQGKQFFLPMVLHRMLKSRPLCAGLEAVPRALGLTALAGSPVIAEFRRTD